MKRRLALAALLLVACHSHGHDDHGHDDHGKGAHDDHGHDDHAHGSGAKAADERPALAFTHWTTATELFMELDALVVGAESPCAAHVTRLADFTPLAEGTVTVVLKGGPGEERFTIAAPSVAGIFRPIARPAAAGKRQLVVEIRGAGVTADHDLGEVTVFESAAAARAAHPEEPEAPGITFLKEQQWPIGFTTAPVTEAPVRATVPVLGEVRARSEGEVRVTAPVAGRVEAGSAAFPRLGNPIRAGQVLALLAPRLEAADRASLQHGAASARLALRYATRERERAQGLRDDGAVSERRLAEAERTVAEARLELRAAEGRLAQFQGATRGRGDVAAGDLARRGGGGGVELRAALDGTVTAVEVAPGSFVEAGAPLFRVTDLGQPWLALRVAEADLSRLEAAGGAWLQVEGLSTPLELPSTALVARAGALDPRTRTLELLYAPAEGTPRLVMGAAVRGRLAAGPERRALVVPEAAVIDDGGTDVVYVHAEGERFERRVVRVGVTDRGQVELVAGVTAGERVAHRGAWSVKLAASSGSLPAHGHAH